jgi:plasmid maintenance system antidote protein VapI
MGKPRGEKRKPSTSVCDQLRQAIKASSWTHYRVAKQAGIKPEIVTRFVKGERDIRAETFAKIAAALGMELAPKKGAEDGRSIP